MSELVERRCQVVVNERLGATFFKLDGDEEEIWGEDTEDCDIRDFMEALRDPGTHKCGAPAPHYVDYGEDRVYMCDLHYAMCQDTATDTGDNPYYSDTESGW